MESFKFGDVQILSPSLNGRQELVFRCKVQKIDYSLADYQKLCETCDTVQFAMVLQPFQEQAVDRKPKLIQTLVMTVKDYCEKGGYDEEEETQRIRNKYSVNSRTELTERELEDTIESYRMGMESF